MENVRIAEFRKDLKLRVSKGLSMHYIRDWVNGTYGDEVDWDVYLPTKGKNLQRGFVWTLLQKQSLILSILKGIKIPPICAIQYREYSGDKCTFKIIDGKQRLSTIFSFYKGEFPIIFDGQEIYYKDLAQDAQAEIGLMMPTFDIVYEYPDTLIPDEQKIAWFEMINFAGTPQDIAHLNDLKS